MYAKSRTTISAIFDSAQRLFVIRAYDDISMSDIAQEAGITKGAIYHHFASKQQLFISMMVRYLNNLHDILQKAVDTIGTADERLRLLTQLYLETPTQDQRVIQLVRRDSNRFIGEERETLVRAYQRALPDQIAAIISDGIQSGEIKAGDVRLLAWQYVAIVEVSLSDYARQRFDSPAKMANYLTNIFFDGVRRQP